MKFIRRVIAHLTWLRRLPHLLNPAQRRRMTLLAVVAVIDALFAAMAIASIVPVVAILADPTAVESNPTVAGIAQLAGLASREEAMYATSALLAILFTIRFVLRMVAQGLRVRFTEAVTTDVARRLLSGFVNRPYTYHLTASTPQLVAVVVQDSVKISTLAGNVITSFSTAATVVAVFGAMLLIDPVVTGAAIVATALLGAVTYAVQHRRVGALGREIRQRSLRVPHHATQALGSIRETQLMGVGEQQVKAVARDLRAAANLRARLALVQRLPELGLEWLVFLGVAATLAMMAGDPAGTASVIPTMAAFFFAAIRIVPQAMAAVRKVVTTQVLRPSFEAVYRLLVTEPALPPEPGDKNKLMFQHSLECRDVEVHYNTGAIPALRGVTLTIPRGAHVGIAGPSGAGKTTLVNALLGFLTPTAGTISVDGRSIHEGLRSWQQRIGLVPQDLFLLDDSIRANITFGREFPDEDQRLARVLAAVRLDEFIATLPKGVEAGVGERGIRVSGGQRQRIAIARALYGDPELIVLDEATSALDPEIAAAIDDAIAALRGRKTLIVVAHRLVSMSRCDFVIYMDGGRIVDTGPLHELQMRNASFARFAGANQPLRAVATE